MARKNTVTDTLCWSDGEDAERPFIEPASIDGRAWTESWAHRQPPRKLRTRIYTGTTPRAVPACSQRMQRTKERLQLRTHLLLKATSASSTPIDASPATPHASSDHCTTIPGVCEPPKKMTRLGTFMSRRVSSQKCATDTQSLPPGTVRIKQLQDALIQQSASPLQAARRVVLVSGPAGSGKRTAVRRTCDAAGVACVSVTAYAHGEDWVRVLRHTHVPWNGVLLVTGVDGLDGAQWNALAATVESNANDQVSHTLALHPHACVVLVCRSRACLPPFLCAAHNVVAARFMGDVKGVRAARHVARLPTAFHGTPASVDWRQVTSRRVHEAAHHGNHTSVASAAHTDLLLVGRSVARHMHASAALHSSAACDDDMRTAIRVITKRPAVIPMLHAFTCAPRVLDALVCGDVCATVDWKSGGLGHALAAELATRAYVKSLRCGKDQVNIPPAAYDSCTQRQLAAKDAAARLTALHLRNHQSSRAAALETDLMLQAGQGAHGKITRASWPYVKYTFAN